MYAGFVLKKLLSLFVHVVPGMLLLLLLLLIGRRWFPRFCHTASLVICIALIAASLPPVSKLLVTPLETRFPVLQAVPADTGLILVLGAGHIYRDNTPPNSILRATALSRLTEAVRLWRTAPDVSLAVSGRSPNSQINHAEAMKNMAVTLGVPENKIVVFSHTLDTEAEIRAAAGHLKNLPSPQNQRVVVVSSATHLPRTEMLLKHHVQHYSMAPTDFLAGNSPWYRAGAGELYHLDRAVHEWVGMLWLRLKQSLGSYVSYT